MFPAQRFERRFRRLAVDPAADIDRLAEEAEPQSIAGGDFVAADGAGRTA